MPISLGGHCCEVTVSLMSHCPFVNCLPGTELLRSPLTMEFSMGSLSLHYLWSLQCYHRSPWQLEIVQGPMAIIARLTKHCKTMLNIVTHSLNIMKHSLNIMKHSYTSWNTFKTSLNIHQTSWITNKTSWTTNKTSWNTHKTLWNIMKHSNARSSMQQYWRCMRVSGNIGDCIVGITLQMCGVSCPMLNPVPKSVHFFDYLNFEALFDFFLWSIC